MKRLDPPRLLESEAVEAELRTLLAAGADDLAPPDVLARSAQRLSVALGVQVTPPAAHVTGAKAAGSAAAGTKWLGLSAAAAIKSACVVALVSSASLLAWRVMEPRTRDDARAVQPVRVASPPIDTQPRSEPAKLAQPVVVPASTPVTPTVPAPQPHDARARVPRRTPARVEPSQAPAPAQATPSAPAPDRALELRALEAAHAVLASDPVLALQRLRALARTYPNGWLDEERSALEVEALLRLGQRDDAARALAQLQARHPHAAALPRLQHALGHVR